MAEAAQDAAKPARKKNAHYDVFAQDASLDSRAGVEPVWVRVATDVQAASRREAIVKAMQDDDDAYGTFATVRSGEFQVLTRAKKTIVADDWGAA